MKIPSITKLFNKSIKPKLGPNSLAALSRANLNVARGGRTTVDTTDMTSSIFDNVIPRDNPSGSWATLQFQRKNLLNLPFSRLLKIAMDLSPQINKAHSDFLRFCNPGYLNDNENDVALASTIDFQKQIGNFHGSFASHVDEVFSSIFFVGGAFLELVLDKGAFAPLDIVNIDPLTASYRRNEDPLRGQYMQLGQMVNFEFVPIDDNRCVKYIGFDRVVGNPYGRPIVGGGVYSALFLLGLIQDLRRVIANQGLSRIDYELDAEEVLKLIAMNPEIAGDDAATASFIADQIEKVRNALSTLEPDSDYVHLSTVKVNYAQSSMQTNLSGLDVVIKTLQREITTGIKSVSVLQNINESTADTYATRQLEFYVAATQSVQEEIQDVFNEFFDIGNQVQGLSSQSAFQFKRQRVLDRRVIAETEGIQIDNVIKKVENDFIDDAEAKEEISTIKDSLISR